MPKIRMADLASAGFTAAGFSAAVEEFRQAKLDHRMTVGVPAPIAPHPLVEDAVRRVQAAGQPDDFVPDYEVVLPTVAERKQELRDEVTRLEAAALAIITPPGKARLWQMDVQRARRVAEYARTDEQQATLAAHAARAERIDAVNYHAAKLAADIDDLNEADIDDWKIEPFPT